MHKCGKERSVRLQQTQSQNMSHPVQQTLCHSHPTAYLNGVLPMHLGPPPGIQVPWQRAGVARGAIASATAAASECHAEDDPAPQATLLEATLFHDDGHER